jgi:hypothetical protein
MDGLTQGVYNVIEGALSILPDSPFQFLYSYSNSVIGEWLGWLNWFIPVNSFVSILAAWCSAILVWYVIQIILRWAKAIE